MATFKKFMDLAVFQGVGVPWTLSVFRRTVANINDKTLFNTNNQRSTLFSVQFKLNRLT